MMKNNIQLKEVVLTQSEYLKINEKIEEYEKWKNNLDIVRLTIFKNIKDSEPVYVCEITAKDKVILELENAYKTNLDVLRKEHDKIIWYKNTSILELTSELDKIKSKWWYKLFK